MIAVTIKFISADGLVAYEQLPVRFRPEEILFRTGHFYRPLSVVADHDGLPPPMETVRRAYRLRDSYVHPETGVFICEYKEMP